MQRKNLIEKLTKAKRDIILKRADYIAKWYDIGYINSLLHIMKMMPEDMYFHEIELLAEKELTRIESYWRKIEAKSVIIDKSDSEIDERFLYQLSSDTREYLKQKAKGI